MTKIYEGKTKGNSTQKIAIITSKFNEFITEKLLDGCIQTLTLNEISSNHIDVIKVPGAFELPTAAYTILDSGEYDSVICLGAVIRGETSHYDHICDSISAELARLGAISGIPVIFGVITCENVDQAQARAGGKIGNKGSEAALAALEMMDVLNQLNTKEKHSCC